MNDEKRYYRVCFRGLVSLISSPNARAPKTGHFLSYGDVITTSDAEVVFDTDSKLHENKNFLDIKSSCSSSRTSAIKKRQRAKFVRVDQILTAGLPNVADLRVLSKSNTNESCQKTAKYRLIQPRSTSCTTIRNSPALFSMNDSVNENENKSNSSFPSMELHPTEESLHHSGWMQNSVSKVSSRWRWCWRWLTYHVPEIKALPSTLSIFSDFDVHSLLLQPAPHWSKRYRRLVPHILSSLIGMLIVFLYLPAYLFWSLWFWYTL